MISENFMAIFFYHVTKWISIFPFPSAVGRTIRKGLENISENFLEFQTHENAAILFQTDNYFSTGLDIYFKSWNKSQAFFLTIVQGQEKELEFFANL